MRVIEIVAFSLFAVVCASAQATTLGIALPGGADFALDQSIVPLITFADSGDPYGTLRLTSYASPDCSSGIISVGDEQVRDGIGSPNYDFHNPIAGTYSMSAQYLGAGINGSGPHDYAASACATYNIATAQPAIDVWLSAGTQYGVNQQIVPRAVLSGAGPSIVNDSAGVAVFTGSSCQIQNELLEQPAQAANGVLNFGFTLGDFGAGAGTYSIQALFNGDASNAAARSECLSFTLTQADVILPGHTASVATLTLPTTHFPGNAAAVTPTTALQNVTATAGGSYTIVLYTDPSCRAGTNINSTTEPVVNGTVAGTATFNLSGSHGFRGFYNGDSNNGSAVSACAPVSIAPNAIWPSLTFRGAPNFVGDIFGALQPQATLFGSTHTAGGTVTYTSYSSSNCASGSELANTLTGVLNGVPASISDFPHFNAGSFSMSARYSGDSNNLGAVTCLPYQVVDPSQALLVSDAFAQTGSASTFSAQFIVTRPVGGGLVTVDIATLDDSAIAGVDYDSVNGTLVFNSNDIIKYINVTVHGSAAVAPNKRFFMLLGNPVGGIIVDGFAKGLLIDPRDRIFNGDFE